MLNIRIKEANYKNEKSVLSNISLDVDKAEKLVILGETGCGKSTLLKIVGGLHKEFDGSVAFDGQPLSNKTTRIGYMPQRSSLLPWYTVLENVISLKKARDKRFNLQEAEDLLKSLKILELKDKYPNKISGGQQQRAALAGIVYFEPEIILMDEPFSALDEVTREEIQTLFLNLQRAHGFITLFVTHSVEEAVMMADRIIVIHKGAVCHDVRITNIEPWSEAFYRQANELREGLRRAKME